VLAQTAAAVGVIFSGASMASADGAVSKTTQARSRGIYGGRILDLEAAVAKGDLSAIAAEKNAFTLFVSGAYTTPGAINKAVSLPNAL
jgi:hypothetical protein